MKRKCIALKVLLILAGLLLLPASHVLAQQCCQGDTSGANGIPDGKVGAWDYGVLKSEFGITDCVACWSPVPKTGQTTCYNATGYPITCDGTGQDGDHLKGVEWPNPRFTDNVDGTVTDNLTGLMWTKNGMLIPGTCTWLSALTACNDLNYATYTDWRLPNVKELLSLIDYSQIAPALPNGYPFINVNISNTPYWSSTTCMAGTGYAWGVCVGDGDEDVCDKDSTYNYVWPARGGH